jgi:acyl-CoA reductase-like NAD-dependent aldehyde dehydrogenase
VVAAFVPWNVPLLMAAWKLAPALAAGNTIVIRPSRRTPLSALALAREAAENELVPPGVVNAVVGDREQVGSLLIQHPDIALVALTGSADAGRKLARLAAHGPKPLHLQLGGNTPILVCGDADIDRAGETIVRGALDNAGQDCTAATRVLAVDLIADRLIERLGEALTRTRIGPPADRSTELGPLIGRDRREAVLELIDAARRDGAREAVRASEVGERGWFLSPGLLADVRGDSSIVETEIFGPVVTVERCADEAEAVRRANASRYALAAGIWTRSMPRGLSMAAALDAGKIWVNEHHRDVTEMPHGGTKDSGYGSDLSVLAVEHYSRPKAVHIALTEAQA